MWFTVIVELFRQNQTCHDLKLQLTLNFSGKGCAQPKEGMMNKNICNSNSNLKSFKAYDFVWHIRDTFWAFRDFGPESSLRENSNWDKIGPGLSALLLVSFESSFMKAN